MGKSLNAALSAEAALRTDPVRLHIHQVKFDFNRIDERHWGDHNPYLTHYLAALFEGFPAGERWFVDTVREHMPLLKDPVLREEARLFMIQEANHGRVHQEFSDWISANRVNTVNIFGAWEKFQGHLERILEPYPKIRLAIHVAIEHVTATVSASLLEKPEALAVLHPQVRALVVWHAIEEIEHRHVVFDIYKLVGGSYLLRATTTFIVTLAFLTTTPITMLRLAKRDGTLLQWKAALQNLRFFFGKDGIYTRVARRYFAFLRPSFHPSQDQIDHLLPVGLAQLEALMPVKIGRSASAVRA